MATTTLDFTRAKIEALPPPAKGRKVYHDQEVAGLVCRVTSAGSKSFWLVRWAASRPRWLRLGDHPRTPVELARKMARQMHGRIDAGDRPWDVRAKDRADGQLALGDLWETYLDRHALPSKRPASVRQDCWMWGRVLAPTFKARYLTVCEGHPPAEVAWAAKGEVYDQRADRRGHVIAGTRYRRARFPCPTCGVAVDARWVGGKLIGDLTADQVRNLHTRVTDERGATLANRTVVLLQTMYAKAAPGQENPAKLSSTYRHQETSRVRHMDAVEVGFFWEAVNDEPEPWPLFFIIAATVGARKANILSMPWPSERSRELNLTSGAWQVPPHKSKGGEAVTLYVAQQVCDRLREWRQICPSKVWVFPNADDPERHAVDPSRAWERVRWRMESRRLLLVLARQESWPPQRLDAEVAGLPELAERFWRAALGRHESSQRHPLARVVDALRDRVIAAGGDPAEGTVLDLHFHDIRRSVGAHMAMAGHSETEIGRLLGHAAGSKSTRVYARIGQDHAARMAAAAAAKMLGHNPGASARLLHVPVPS